MRSTPSIATDPDVERTMPVITFTSVVLPAPFGPMMPTTSPPRASRPAPSRATKPPKTTDTLGGPQLGVAVGLDGCELRRSGIGAAPDATVEPLVELPVVEQTRWAARS